MSNITSRINEIHKKIKLMIRLGDPKDRIITSIIRTYGGELGEEEIKREASEVIDNYGDYALIQTIMRSKIIKEISGKDYFILDNKNRKTIPITVDSLRNMFHHKLDISDRIYTCQFKYDPYSMKQLYRDETGLWIYNQYVPPFWQEDTFFSQGELQIEAEDNIPEVYTKFLMHLVADDLNSFNYILDWLANSLQRRNFCILTTISHQGTGKGTLGKIMQALVGKENFSETSNKIIAERFNSQIKNKRIVYCDEASVKSQKEEERLKSFVNSALEVEAKGKDAEVIENYASFYFSSNSLDAIRLTADDRRFSIVNLTDTSLLNALTIAEIKQLTEQKNIDKLARYLYYREVDEDRMLRVFVSARTEEIRQAGLAGWHDWFLDEFAIDNAGKTVKIDEISSQVEDKYGTKFRPSKKAFMELAKIYPKKLHVFKPLIDGKQVWAVKFPDKV